MIRDKLGFTLIELVMVIAILMITVGVASDVIISITRSYSKTQVSNEIEQNANFVLLKLEKELRNGKDILQPTVALPGNNQLKFIDKNNMYVCYTLDTTTGLLSRSINAANNCNNPQDLTNNTTATGIVISTAGTAFNLVRSDPDVIRLNLTFSSAATTSTAFTGSVTLNDTIVARGTY